MIVNYLINHDKNNSSFGHKPVFKLFKNGRLLTDQSLANQQRDDHLLSNQ